MSVDFQADFLVWPVKQQNILHPIDNRSLDYKALLLLCVLSTLLLLSSSVCELLFNETDLYVDMYVLHAYLILFIYNKAELSLWENSHSFSGAFDNRFSWKSNEKKIVMQPTTSVVVSLQVFLDFLTVRIFAFACLFVCLFARSLDRSIDLNSVWNMHFQLLPRINNKSTNSYSASCGERQISNAIVTTATCCTASAFESVNVGPSVRPSESCIPESEDVPHLQHNST